MKTLLTYITLLLFVVIFSPFFCLGFIIGQFVKAFYEGYKAGHEILVILFKFLAKNLP